MSNRKRKYLKIVKTIKRLIKSARIPKFSSKYSNKIFNNWQHFVMLVFRQFQRKTYRDFMDWLEFSKLPSILRLKRIPHFTTLQKFAQRIKSIWIEALLNSICKVITLSNLCIGIDSTGFSLDRASHYYCERIGRKVRGFVKLSSTGDMDKQLILSARIRKKTRHDAIDFKTLIRRARNQGSIALVVADKGYDSESNHKFVNEKIRAECVIPPKYKDICICRTHGQYRKFMKRMFPLGKYHKRSKKETIYSVIKRKYDSVLHSHKFRTQKNELLFRIVCYNAEKISEMIFYFLIGFLQSHS